MLEKTIAIFKPRSNDHNILKQRVVTLFIGATSARLATLLRHVGCCLFKYENKPTTPNAAGSPNADNICCTKVCCYLLAETFSMQIKTICVPKMSNVSKKIQPIPVVNKRTGWTVFCQKIKGILASGSIVEVCGSPRENTKEGYVRGHIKRREVGLLKGRYVMHGYKHICTGRYVIKPDTKLGLERYFARLLA